MFDDGAPDIDLGDYPLGWTEPNKTDYTFVEHEYPAFTFWKEVDLLTSTIFQRHLQMALAHKDKEIAELREELMKATYG